MALLPLVGLLQNLQILMAVSLFKNTQKVSNELVKVHQQLRRKLPKIRRRKKIIAIISYICRRRRQLKWATNLTILFPQPR